MAEQLQRASGLSKLPEIAGIDLSQSEGCASVVGCPGTQDGTPCQAEWCSAACRTHDSALHSVVHSAAYAPVLAIALEENRVFDTAARCLVAALAKHVQERVAISEVLGQLLDCVSGDWWNLVEMPDDVPLEEAGDFRKAMKEMAHQGHAAAAEAIKSSALATDADPAAVAELLEPSVFFHVLGALHLNSIQVDIEDDPVLGILEAVAAAPEALRDGVIDQLRPVLEGIVASQGDDDSDDDDDGAGPAEVGEEAADSPANALLNKAIDAAPTLIGTGLFLNIRYCNHACSPNAEVRFSDSAVGELVTLEPIAKGSEILISYFDAEDMDLGERAAELKGYRIESCGCRLCASEG